MNYKFIKIIYCMEETRVDRYKEYRQSFIKEGSISNETNERKIDLKATTSTLPLEEVISAVQKEEQQISFLKTEKRKNTIKFIAKIAVAVIMVSALVVLGIFAWRK